MSNESPQYNAGRGDDSEFTQPVLLSTQFLWRFSSSLPLSSEPSPDFLVSHGCIDSDATAMDLSGNILLYTC